MAYGVHRVSSRCMENVRGSHRNGILTSLCISPLLSTALCVPEASLRSRWEQLRILFSLLLKQRFRYNSFLSFFFFFSQMPIQIFQMRRTAINFVQRKFASCVAKRFTWEKCISLFSVRPKRSEVAKHIEIEIQKDVELTLTIDATSLWREL